MEASADKRPFSDGEGAGRKDRAPSPAQKALIKRNLGLVYNQTLAEEIPQSWLDILDKLPEEKKS